VLSLAASCFFVAATALASRTSRLRLMLAALLASLALATTVWELGVLRGLITGLVLAMTCAGGLVLVLPPRPRLALPIASAGALLGGVLALLHLVRA
jgi:hypothetical protein